MNLEEAIKRAKANRCEVLEKTASFSIEQHERLWRFLPEIPGMPWRLCCHGPRYRALLAWKTFVIQRTTSCPPNSVPIVAGQRWIKRGTPDCRKDRIGGGYTYRHGTEMPTFSEAAVADMAESVVVAEMPTSQGTVYLRGPTVSCVSARFLRVFYEPAAAACDFCGDEDGHRERGEQCGKCLVGKKIRPIDMSMAPVEVIDFEQELNLYKIGYGEVWWWVSRRDLGKKWRIVEKTAITGDQGTTGNQQLTEAPLDLDVMAAGLGLARYREPLLGMETDEHLTQRCEAEEARRSRAPRQAIEERHQESNEPAIKEVAKLCGTFKNFAENVGDITRLSGVARLPDYHPKRVYCEGDE